MGSTSVVEQVKEISSLSSLSTGLISSWRSRSGPLWPWATGGEDVSDGVDGGSSLGLNNEIKAEEKRAEVERSVGFASANSDEATFGDSSVFSPEDTLRVVRVLVKTELNCNCSPGTLSQGTSFDTNTEVKQAGVERSTSDEDFAPKTDLWVKTSADEKEASYPEGKPVDR